MVSGPGAQRECDILYHETEFLNGISQRFWGFVDSFGFN